MRLSTFSAFSFIKFIQYFTSWLLNNEVVGLAQKRQNLLIFYLIFLSLPLSYTKTRTNMLDAAHKIVFRWNMKIIKSNRVTISSPKKRSIYGLFGYIKMWCIYVYTFYDQDINMTYTTRTCTCFLSKKKRKPYICSICRHQNFKKTSLFWHSSFFLVEP